MAPCPVCGLDGGFHDHNNKEGKHAQHEVPRALLLETGWHKEVHEKWKREQAAKLAPVVRQNSWLFLLATRITMKLFGVRFSRPCYDKPRRCPGWAGGGWKYAIQTFCPEEKIGGFWDNLLDGRPRGYLPIDYESKLWMWRFRTCLDCGVVVLPYVIHWLSWRTWWYEIIHFKNTMWFCRLENWWMKKIGRW